MCGIVGYTGPREAGPILIEGLQRLEYRGYDSAGIALVDEDGDLFVEKKAGKLANLQTAIADRTPHAAIGSSSGPLPQLRLRLLEGQGHRCFEVSRVQGHAAL